MSVLVFFLGHWYLSLFSQTFYLHRYAAHKMFTIALTKNLASLNIKKEVENLIEDCQNKKK